MSTYPEFIAEYIEEQMRRNDAVIEEMCEQMLTQVDTDYGVHVQNNGDGSVTVTLSPAVPFGEIHYSISATERFGYDHQED